MADEVQHVSTQPESQVAEPQSQEGKHVGADPVEPQTPQDEGQGHEEHPLEPQGERFKQVWARAKEAERKADALAALSAFVQTPGISTTTHAGAVLALPNLAKTKPGFVDRLIHEASQAEGGTLISFEKAARKLPGARCLLVDKR